MELLHILNRGVDRRKIFLDRRDYLRFIHDLFEFNDKNPVGNLTYYFKNKPMDVGHPYIRKREPRKLLVKIHAFCLMPNHYHLLLTPLVKDGIPLFVKKLNGGYAKYFNERYQRKGTLFEGRYKRVLVKDETHFFHLPYYIHFNPLDLIMPEWRNQEIRDSEKAVNFLENYKWSSHLDYLGKKNFPSVTQREFLLKVFGGHEEYGMGMKGWLKSLDTKTLTDLFLEG